MADSQKKSNNPGDGGWKEYQVFVLSELKRLNVNYEALKDELRDEFASLRGDITGLKTDVSALKVKSGVWGMIGGLIPVAIIIVVWILQKVMMSSPS